MNTIHLALIEDQKLFRQSLVALMDGVPEFKLVMEAENGNDCMEKLAMLPQLPNIILTDMEMPEMDGMALTLLLQKKYPTVKIIILSVHAKERLIARMIDAGASGYLIKNCDKEELINAIQTVYHSGFYINAQVLKAIQNASLLKNKPIKNINNIPVELSSRELEILQLVCKEFSNTEIAEQLFLSARTVEGHRNNLLSKTGCRNTAGLVLFAVKYHLFEVGF